MLPDPECCPPTKKKLTAKKKKIPGKRFQTDATFQTRTNKPKKILTDTEIFSY